MDGRFPPEDWLNGVEDTTESFNVWLMDEDESGETWSTCVSFESFFSCGGVVFSLAPSLSHAVVQFACVVLSWVRGSAGPGPFLGTVEEQSVRSSSRQRR